MSTFIEKLNQQVAAESQPIGFKKMSSLNEKRLLIAVEVADSAVSYISQLITLPDAFIINAEGVPDRLDIIKTFQHSDQTGIGIKTGAAKPENIAALINDKGCFIVISLHDSVTNPPLAMKNSRIMEIDAETEAETLKAAAETGIDAFWIKNRDPWTNELTWLHLISARRVTNLVSKPILIAGTISARDEELQALWLAGIDGITVTLPDHTYLEELAQLIDRVHRIKLPARPSKIRSRIVTPYPSGLFTGEEEEETNPPDT